MQTANGDENRVEPDEKAESDRVRTIPVAGRISSAYFDPHVEGLVGDRCARSSPAPGTPESVRENVWPGRTAPTVHWSDGAVPMRFTMT